MSLPGRLEGDHATEPATTAPTPRRLGVAATISDAGPPSRAASTPSGVELTLPHTGPAAPAGPVDDEAATITDGGAAPRPPLPDLPVDPTRFPLTERDTYIIAGKFAQGGIGRILRAHDPRLDRPVALKELLVHGRPVDEERFIREVLLTARLQHPGIVPVYAAGRWPSGEPFYAMKLVSGRSFDRVIAEAKELAARLALLPHVLAIAETVAYAHSQRIIHRDLKPHNVLVGAFGETVVIDWGLAKELDGPGASQSGRAEAPLRPSTVPPARDLTFVGAVVGTPGYMSPEQADGAAVDTRTDVYALGAILYHVLTGRLPFDASNPMNMVYKTVYEEPVPLGSREPSAPEELVAIVEKAMARDPAARYPSAQEFAEDLRRFQTGQIVGAHRYTPWERVRRFVRRNRAVLALAAASLLLIVLVTAYSFVQIREERDDAETARVDAEAARDEAETARAFAVAARDEAEKARELALRRADNLAFEQARLLQDDDPTEALRLLHDITPAADWRRLRQLAAALSQRGVPAILRGHRAAVSRIAFSPDGARMATTSDDCTLRVWDMSSRTSRAYRGHTDEVWRAAWSPDQRRIASSSKDKTVRVWDVETGEVQVLVGHTNGVRNVVFAPDGRTLYASDDDETLRRWDLDAGTSVVLERCSGNNYRWTERWLTCFRRGGEEIRVYDLETGEASTIRASPRDELAPSGGISPDGRWFASSTRRGALWLWDRRTGVGRDLDLLPTGLGHARFTQREVRFSADSTRLLAPAESHHLHYYDLVGRRGVALLPHEGYTRRAALSPDGRLAVSVGGDARVSVWDSRADTTYSLAPARAHMIDTQVSPDGRWIAAVGNDPRVFVWSPGSFLRDQWISPAPGVQRSFALGSESALVPLARGFQVVDLRRMTSGPEVPLDFAVKGLGISRDGGTALATGDDVLVVWSLARGEVVLRHRHGGRCDTHKIHADPSGPRFAFSCVGDRLWWVDPAAADPVSDFGAHPGSVPLVFVPEREAAVFGTQRGELFVSEGPGGPPRLLRTFTTPVLSLASVPGAAEFIVGGEGTVVRHHLDAGASTTYAGHRLQVSFVLVSRDGRNVVTTSRDNMIRVFDRETGALRFELFPPDLLERVGDISPDGTRLVVGVISGDVLVWDISEDGGDPQVRDYRRLPGRPGLLAVGFLPDGRTLATIDAEQRITRWRDDLPAEPDGVRRWIADHVDATDPPKSETGCAAPTDG